MKAYEVVSSWLSAKWSHVRHGVHYLGKMFFTVDQAPCENVSLSTGGTHTNPDHPPKGEVGTQKYSKHSDGFN